MKKTILEKTADKLVNVFVNLIGSGAIILLLTNALTNLSAVFSNMVFFIVECLI